MDLVQRRAWNENHKRLTGMILKADHHQEAVERFLPLHALLFSSVMSGSSSCTFEDAVWADLEEEVLRRYPVQAPDTKNSMVWHIWHLTRVEDMTMNILVADGPQVLHSGDWQDHMNIRFAHSGNGMGNDDIAELSSRIQIDALRAYRNAVGKQTRSIISSLEPGSFKEKVQDARISRLFEEHAILPEASGIAEYWSRKTIAGLVLMPATRHHVVHWNKCARIKARLQKRTK